MKIAVLLSGTGRTLENLLGCIAHGTLNVEIVAVISNKVAVRGNEVAIVHKLPFFLLPEKFQLGQDLFCILGDCGVQLLCLAGFTAKLTVPETWLNKIMNIHPALLPSFGGKGFYGEKVHKAVLEHGCKVSGCTVHFVDNEYDHGPIILQKAVEVKSDDTPENLAYRVFQAECQAYPEAIRLFQSGALQVSGRCVYH